MVDTKPLNVVVDKYKAAIGRVPAAYTEGIKNTKNWNQKAQDGQALYAQKMSDPEVLARRGTEIAKVSDSEWAEKATRKGAQRIAGGMTESLPKFSTGMGRVLSTIQGVTIAPRTTDPMANVDNRVKPIVKALADMKKG